MSSGVFLSGLWSRELHDQVCHNASRRIVVLLVLDDFEFHPVLLSDHEECLQQYYCIVLPCVHIGPVEDVYGISLIGNIAHHFGIMDTGICDYQKCRHICFHII